MPKASIANLSSMGFNATQFGGVADWSTAGTGYLALILIDAGLWAEGEIGAVPYAAAAEGSLVLSLLKRAELMHSVSQLWERRAQFIDGNAAIGNSDTGYLTIRECMNNADGAMAKARQAIADAQSALGLEVEIPGSAISVGVVEHGHFSVAA